MIIQFRYRLRDKMVPGNNRVYRDGPTNYDPYLSSGDSVARKPDGIAFNKRCVQWDHSK